ncbi:twin-arginine translocase TatA/TatE family subunit [Streptomyces griseus]|uniref:Twin-arginine translocase TatA/TatE family subunit n=1 Tax=Streptomyces sp. CMC78 TaxID=3231512 RepID=A0AB33KRD9_9ACTN|nr:MULTISPECIES: twin-arginine translocase TatA/TatE family subunit [unclassified Streptomyces]MDX5572376.1 twin-arginine translocase TatA/TatE family subunit [Streptomyces sp. ID01-9D]WSV19244.1 twin-arginine translocase TatA/TatE family subunit [Streptomyces fimicarius]WTC91596.1 twin-arginine translocase TatA/TatE family subunit [Streptomyces griseus]WTD65771.1 twin-arginine translocase TatA/TatE family subunit [Streptomyces griseus]
MFGIGELTILLLVIVAVLAVKRLPDLTRSAGKAARILKSEKQALKEDDGPAAGTTTGDGEAPRTPPRVIRGEATERETP